MGKGEWFNEINLNFQDYNFPEENNSHTEKTQENPKRVFNESELIELNGQKEELLKKADQIILDEDWTSLKKLVEETGFHEVKKVD